MIDKPARHATVQMSAASATFWSGVDILIRQGLHFVVMLVLWRLLDPSAYGTMAIISILVAVATVFIEAGFTSALIQRTKVTDVELSSVLYANIAIASVIGVLMCLGSGALASFYGLPILSSLTVLVAVAVFVGSLGCVQRTILARTLNFKRQCVVSAASTAIAGCIAIAMAWGGAGVWSLAVHALAANVVTTVLLWKTSPWRPMACFSFRAIKTLLSFGGYMVFSGVLDAAFTRLNAIVIGKIYSPADLAYYSTADEVKSAPSAFLTGVISRVALPVFSRIKTDKVALREAFARAISVAMCLNAPMMVLMAATADTLVEVVLGEKWLPCAAYMRILCFAGLLWPLHVLNLNVLLAQGYSNLFFRLEVTKKVIGIAVVAVACVYGVGPLAWSMSFLGIVGFAINAYYSGKYLGFGFASQLRISAIYTGVALLMIIPVIFIRVSLYNAKVLLLCQVSTGLGLYVLLCWHLKLGAFADLVRVAKQRLRFRRFAIE